MIARLTRSVVTACVLLAGLPCAPSAETPARVERVIVVFKTHFDIGYTKLAREVLEQYRTTMIEKALDVCDAARQLPPQQRFVWTLPGWPMEQILRGARPETQARLRGAVADGRLVWHALPGSTHTESMDLEDLVRGLKFSTELSRQFNKPLARDAKMTDVPSPRLGTAHPAGARGRGVSARRLQFVQCLARLAQAVLVGGTRWAPGCSPITRPRGYGSGLKRRPMAVQDLARHAP